MTFEDICVCSVCDKPFNDNEIKIETYKELTDLEVSPCCGGSFYYISDVCTDCAKFDVIGCGVFLKNLSIKYTMHNELYIIHDEDVAKLKTMCGTLLDNVCTINEIINKEINNG